MFFPYHFRVCCISFSILFPFVLSLTFAHSLIDERPRDDDGRGAGVRDPADDHRQAAVRPSGEDHRPARGLVLRAAVHRLEGRPHLDQAVQEG